MSVVAQAPSKVLHFRNLPEHTGEPELRVVCDPFGMVVQIMTAVGKDRNQAFVQFADPNSSAQMLAYYSKPGEQLMIRGKQAYVQYSNRQELTSNPRDNPSNVLLVTMDASAQRNITVDILQALFSPFGFVEKIATFDKGQGFQALIQYNTAVPAQAAKTALDGRPVPHYLAPSALPLPLRINFSSHTDITVKFQGHKSRDYTNPYLPVASNATDLPQASVAPILPPPQSHSSHHEGNVLLCVIDDAAYPMTVDPLHTVFSKYGTVEKIAIFEKNSTWQALVQYSDIRSANDAKLALEGHAIFEGGFNKLRLSTSTHRDLTIRQNNERSWDYTEGRGSQMAQAGGAAPQSNEPNITGIDFEQAHETVVKMANQAMQGGATTTVSVGAMHQPMMQYQAAQHHPMVPGMAGHEAYGYGAAPNQYGMSPMPRPRF